MSGPGLEPDRPAPVLQPAAAGGFWDDDAAGRDSEVWRYARRLAAAAAQEHDRATRRAPAQAAGEEDAARAQPPPATTSAHLRDAAGVVGRALLLVAAAVAGVANGMAVGGSSALPLDLLSWRPPVAQAAPTQGAGAHAADAQAAAALIAGATLTSSARADIVPALPPRVAIAPARAPGWSAGPPVERLVLAAATGGIPAGTIVRPEPPAPLPAPVAIERPATPWRVQLALLRNPRNAEPVWRSFVTRLGALTRGLERHVLPTRTARGLRHLVQAGPFADAGAAEAVCQRLLAAGGDCLVVPPAS